MFGIEYLMGAAVHLETSEVASVTPKQQPFLIPGVSVPPSPKPEDDEEKEIKWQRVLYRMDRRKLTKRII